MPGPFPYLPNFGPTLAPVCRLRVSWNGNTEFVEAVIDTGASWTFVPRNIAIRLRLRKIDEGQMRGATPGTVTSNQYLAHLNFAGLDFTSHPIFDIEREFALIGREILNKYIATFDGPSSQFSIENP